MAAPPVKSRGARTAPLQGLLLTKSGTFGTGLTVVKAASAASMAFAIADRLGPSRFASLGAVVAVFTVQSSIISTLGQGLQRVLGNIVGVAITSLWVERVGTSWWSLLVALLVAIGAARRLPLGFAGQAQIPVSVLLTVALGPATPGLRALARHRHRHRRRGRHPGRRAGSRSARPSAAARQAQSAWASALGAQLEAISGELEAGEKTITDHGRHDFIASSRALAATVTAGERGGVDGRGGPPLQPARPQGSRRAASCCVAAARSWPGSRSRSVRSR